MRFKFAIAVALAGLLSVLAFASAADAELGIVGYYEPSSTAPPANFDPVTGEVFAVRQGDVTVRSSGGGFLRSFGYDAVSTGPDDSATNERQQLTVNATGGYFTLSCCTLNGSSLTTVHLEHNATANQVEEALDELAAIGPVGGSVTVSGGPSGPADPGPYVYTIEFAGALAGDDFQQWGVSTEHLTGNTAIGRVKTLVDGGGFETCVPASGDVCHESFWTGQDGAAPVQGYPQGSISASATLALAPATAPNAGNILVADTNFQRVDEFTPAGVFLRAFGWDVVSHGPDDGSVDEEQTLAVSATGGKFSLSFGGQTTGALGAGEVTASSNTIANVDTTNGAFAIGQVLTATGIPSGTTITGVGAHTLTLSANASSGTGLSRELTANDLPFNASAAQVKAALDALPSIGGAGGSVTVTGPGGGPYTIEFGGTLGGDELVALGTSAAGLSGGEPRATVATLANGGAFETCVAAAGDICKEGVKGQPGVGGSKLGQFAGNEGSLTGIAGDESGAIYVSNAPRPSLENDSNFRVQKFTPAGAGFTPSVCCSPERQSVTVSAAAGQFRLTDFEPAGTLGHGTLHTGSTLVDGVTVGEGEFLVGQPIYEGSRPEGGEISAGTTIAACSPSCAAPTSITLSQPVAFTEPGTATLHSTRAWQTADLEHDATHEQLEAALNALPPLAKAGGVSVSEGPGDPAGSSPYLVSFDSPALNGSNQPQLLGAAGTTPLSGGTGAGANQALVTTVVDGQPGGTANTNTPGDVATDGAGHVYVSRYFPAAAATCPDGSPSPAETRIERFATDGIFEGTSAPCYGIPPGSASGPPNLTVDPLSGEPYLRWATNTTSTSVFGPGDFAFVFGELGPAPSLTLSSPSDISPTGLTISGQINPNGPVSAAGHPNPVNTTYRVQYRIEGETSWTTYAPPTAVGFGTSPVPFSIGVSGLEPKTNYEVRTIVSKLGRADVVGSVQTVTTAPAPPQIDSFSSSNVSAASVDLEARINPRGTDTSYHFEYGTSTSYGHQTPDVDIGASQSPVAVQAHVEGLQPSFHHFRVVATNALGTVRSPDQTFNFYPQSCPNEAARQQSGAVLLPDCRAYELVSPADAGTASLTAGGPNSASATSPSRLAFYGLFGTIPGAGNPPNVVGDLYVATRTNRGWETHYVGIPGDQRFRVGGPPNQGEVGNPPLADLKLGRILDWDFGQQPFGCCGDFGSMAPYMWNAEGQSLGRLPSNLAQVPGAETDLAVGGFLGDVRPSPDFSHYFFSSAEIAFAPGGLTSGNGSVYDDDLATGTVTIVSRLPGSGGDIPPEPGDHTDDYFTLPGVSTDGSHILIAAAGTGVCGQAVCPEAYLHTLCGGDADRIFKCPTGLPSHLYMRVDDAVTYDVSQGHLVHYDGMSADGSQVYFTSAEGLTSDDHDESIDLYRWSEATDSLTRVSAGSSGVVGNTNACSASWISGCGVEVVPVDHNGTSPFGGETFGQPSDNSVAAGSGDVYFYSPEQFVASRGVPGRRNLYVLHGGAIHYVATLDADKPLTRIQVSPDGAHAAFLTASRLTSYDNAGHQEMYAYDPDEESLTCVSCEPSGEPPTSDVEASQNGIFMTNDGRTFFSTRDALVPEDSNGISDVYEYVDSRPQLISSGTADVERSNAGVAGLIGVSGDGVDVYFTTFKPLVAADKNGKFLRFYDARTGGGFPLAAEVAPCQAADECHGPTAAEPALPTIASTAALGTGGNAGPGHSRKQKHGKRHRRHRGHGKRAHAARGHRSGR